MNARDQRMWESKIEFSLIIYLNTIPLAWWMSREAELITATEFTKQPLNTGWK